MSVKFVPGAMLKVPVGVDDFAYGVMLAEFPYMAFYNKTAVQENSDLPTDPPMFIVLVAQAAYKGGRWGKPIRQLSLADIPAIPRFFWQSPVNKNDCKIVEPVKHRVTASPSDCVGLEPEAIWSAEHIESRISDTYAGRPNMFVESLKLKL